MSADEIKVDKVLLDAVSSSNCDRVLEVIHKHNRFSSHVLSESLLIFIQETCKRSDSLRKAVQVESSSDKGYNIIYILVDAGADIEKRDENGNTSLLYAAKSENEELCEILLQCGADMWSVNELGISIFDYVSENSPSADVVNTFNKYYPGLWKAVESEDIYQVRQLINYWCRTNLQKNGLSLKDIALETGNEEIISLILGIFESMDLVYHIFAKNAEAVRKKLETCKKKLRLNLRKMSDHGAPILYYLIQSRDVPIIELFIQHDCQIYTIMQDDMGNDMPVLFSALKPDVPVTVFEALLPQNKLQIEEILYKILYRGKTILEVAMENEVDPEIFKLLIDRGGPLLLCDRNQFNETVYDIALSTCDQQYIEAITECVQEWILNPAEYSERRLKLTIFGWDFEHVNYLKDECDDENVYNFFADLDSLQDLIRRLSQAVENGDVSKFLELINTVYDSNLCEVNMLWHARVVGDGMPLLHQAVLFNRPEIVEIILDDKPVKESIDNLFDQHHRTALHYAFAYSTSKKIQKLLLNCGCSEHVLDKMNKEPLDFKEKQGTPSMMKLIDRLKHKNFSEYEPDPWDDVPDSETEENEPYCCDEECCFNSQQDQSLCHRDGHVHGNAVYESEDEEEDGVPSEEEQQSRSQCHIS